MILLGINIGKTGSGLSLADGGAAIADEHRILASVAEERLTRRKYAAGFDAAVPYLLERLGLCPSDVDVAALSFCRQEVPSDVSHWQRTTVLGTLPRARVLAMPSHHLSHALMAHHFSGFEEALICVFDNEGSALSSEPSQSVLDPHERSSYFVASHGNIRLLHRDQTGSGEASLGDVYRQFTHFLGFKTGLAAGKTMGLAGYGSPGAFAGLRLFELREGRIISTLPAVAENPASNVERFFERHGVAVGRRRSSDAIPTQRDADVARFVQDQLEQIICRKIDWLIGETGMRDVCLGGGVAYNVLLNTAILERTRARRMFVHPASGDQGQCLGNVLFAAGVEGLHLNREVTPYLGPEASSASLQVVRASLRADDELLCVEGEETVRLAAKLIAAQLYIGCFRGRSEVGPRALGHRSILADPRQSAAKDHLNARIKHRESFRPFAPAVLAEHWDEYFEGVGQNPWMLFSARLKNNPPIDIPAVRHVDGTARPQMLRRGDCRFFYRLIEEFRDLTGCPVLLNTSFNLAGEPIVETPQDAESCFRNSLLDALLLEDCLAIKLPSLERGGLDASELLGMSKGPGKC